MEETEVSKIVFCNIAHMKYYRGVTEEDQPVNGGKFVNDNGTAYECYNFFPVNHFCYGYFQHRGNILNLERVDESGKNADVLHNISVIWVANRKIVGWYEKADMFREWKSFNEPEFDKNHEWWDHWFKAREENVYLIPEDKRNFDIPSAPKLGKGMGMGQSNIWYADTDWAKQIFLPAVKKYLQSLQGRFPIQYLITEDINKKILPTNILKQDLFARACNMLETGQYLRALKVFNYLIYHYLTPYRVCVAKYYRGLALEKLLLYDEAIESYKRAAYEFNQLDNTERRYRIDLDCLMQLGRIYAVLGKNSFAYSMWEKIFEEEKNTTLRCDALFRMMWTCKEEENWEQLKNLILIYDTLQVDEFSQEVKEFKKILKKIKK